jgi:hypothetical protein
MNVTYFVKVGIELLNITGRGTNNYGTGDTVEHTGLSFHKVAHSAHAAALYLP